MNSIFWIILIALILDFTIGFVSTILNMRSLQSNFSVIASLDSHHAIGLELGEFFGSQAA